MLRNLKSDIAPPTMSYKALNAFLLNEFKKLENEIKTLVNSEPGPRKHRCAKPARVSDSKI